MNAYYHPMLHKSLAIPKSTKSTASACPCPSVPVRVRPCPSVPVRARPCLSVSVRARRPHSPFLIPRSAFPVLALPFPTISPLPPTHTTKTAQYYGSFSVQKRPKWSKKVQSIVQRGRQRSKTVQKRTLFYPHLSSSYTICARYSLSNPLYIVDPSFPKPHSRPGRTHEPQNCQEIPPIPRNPDPHPASRECPRCARNSVCENGRY